MSGTVLTFGDADHHVYIKSTEGSGERKDWSKRGKGFRSVNRGEVNGEQDRSDGRDGGSIRRHESHKAGSKHRQGLTKRSLRCDLG